MNKIQETNSGRLSQERQLNLLTRLRARDESALGELYDLLAPWVLGLAYRILHDDDEAAEVVSDVFVHVWTRIEQHDAQRGGLTPWVLSIARNRALDLLRRRRRWWRRTERAGALEPAVVDPESDVEYAVPGWPVHRAVHAALAELPEEQGRLVQLAYFEGLSHSEIARRTGEPLGTIKTRLRMAQRHLAERLAHLRDWIE
ncbi:MAG TPA: sigma-70 family RNA polymerase sigma factor [Gemmatimonadales bacterium]|nr:sigma-70 family RNA polymerase sigma factor [Gemmatimonadales bacterium]